MRREVVVVAAVAAAAATAGCCALMVWYRRSSRRWRRAERIVRELRKGCATPAEKLWEVADAMAAEMAAGLASEGGSNLRMLPTPSISLPTGEEEGVFYGLEVGRTTIRMLRVQLGGKVARIINEQIVEVPVPSSLMVGTSKELYKYIADELVKFISEEEENSNVKNERSNNIGASFAFPVVQSSATNGFIVEWKKGFSIKEKEERDVVSDINEALEKHGVEMQVSVLVNDTIGMLAGGRYSNSDTVAAIILGTGTNAAYTEPLDAVPKWQSSHSEHKEMVINTEWGDFKSAHLPITEFDVRLDAESPRPGDQIFEKLISGLYLGDIVRRVLLKLAEETALFGDSVPLKIRIPFALRTPDMASMHQDTSQDLGVVADILQGALGISNTTLRMRKLVVDVCYIVARRGARLAAAGIVGILEKLDRDGTDRRSVVMVEGGLYEHYRLYREYLHQGVKEMLRGKLSDNVVLEQLADGPGIGAALLAASNSNHVRNS